MDSQNIRIGILGFGKMGKAIAELAPQHGIDVAWFADSKTDKNTLDIGNVDVLIDVSSPYSAVENITFSLEKHIPIVSGTTGWLNNWETIENICKAKKGKFLYASNFSVGVNIFFAINDHLSKIMNNYSDYKPRIEEIHHIHKKDSPSGTAITLANIILHNQPQYQNWVEKTEEERENPSTLYITSHRENEVPGTHTVEYSSLVDSISLTHTAKSRFGFANGALIAAKWLFKQQEQGIYTMRDVLQL